MPLSLDSRFCGDVYIVECRGRIVAGAEVKSLEAALDLGVREFNRLVLYIAEVDRLDSTGMGLLMRYAATTRKRGGDIRLAAPPPFVVTLLNVTKLSTVLKIYLTEEDAIVSFLKEHPAQVTKEKGSGSRVLVLDQSADLCAFVRTVLLQHGYDVRTTSRYRDARILLQVEPADFILVGPGNPQLSADTIVGSLKALAPKAAAMHLGADFKYRDAHDATQALLQMFAAKGSSAASDV